MHDFAETVKNMHMLKKFDRELANQARQSDVPFVPGHQPGYEEAEPPGSDPQRRVGCQRDIHTWLECVKVGVEGEESAAEDVTDGGSDHEKGLKREYPKMVKIPYDRSGLNHIDWRK